jgi:hypothetical protein
MIYLQSTAARYAIWLACATLAILPALDARAYDKPEPPPALRNMPPDGWGGASAHFGYSAGMGMLGSYVAPKHPWPVFFGCLGVGVMKELRDRDKAPPGFRHGLFSRNDLKMDALGCAAGVGLFRYVKEF